MKAERLPATTQTAPILRHKPPLPDGSIRRVGGREAMVPDGFYTPQESGLTRS